MKFKFSKRQEKCILTTEGYIKFKRNIYVPSNEYAKHILREKYRSKTFIPLDIYLGIHKLPFRVTADMALRIAFVGASTSSYGEAQKFFQDAYDIKIGDDRIREVTDYLGKIVFDDDTQKMEQLTSAYDKKKVRSNKANCLGPNPNENERFVLYNLMDGGTLNSRDKKDKNGSTYREYKLGMVFKSSDLIIKQKISDEGLKTVEMSLGEKREYVCYVGKVDEFKKYLLALSIKNGLYDAEEVVVLGDGAPWIEGIFGAYFDYGTRILDLYHLFENVGSFAHHIIKNSAQRAEWINEVCELLEAGAWQQVLGLPEVREYKTKKTPDGVCNLHTYITNHKGMLNYPEYKRLGYFVGSGAIEGGIKNVGQCGLLVLRS